MNSLVCSRFHLGNQTVLQFSVEFRREILLVYSNTDPGKHFRSKDLLAKWQFFEKSFRLNYHLSKQPFGQMTIYRKKLFSVKWLIFHFGVSMTIFHFFSVKRLNGKKLFRSNDFFGKITFRSVFRWKGGEKAESTFVDIVIWVTLVG
jgi:hypothetical protein